MNNSRFVPTEAIGFTGLNDRVSKQDLVVKRHTELVQEFLQLLEGRNQESKKVRCTGDYLLMYNA